ncbi:MAG: YncE family protein [Pirellulales bacterium]
MRLLSGFDFSRRLRLQWLVLLLAIAPLGACQARAADDAPEDRARRYLYVAVPGIRNYLEYGGHGLLVFDMDQGHKFVQRIPTGGRDDAGRPINVKGICVSAATGRLYISTLKQLMCLDLPSRKLLWERKYDTGCDRMSITPDGKTIYLPSLEGPHWYVVNAEDGEVTDRIVVNSGAHNTVCALSGKHVYLAGLQSPLLRVVDTKTGVVTTVGPFAASIRPFTIDGRERYCYVNVNELLGFEVGDLHSGNKIHRVEVQGVKQGRVKRHGCPSHGIGLTPDEKEIWVTDGANSQMHVFDATVMPPKQVASIELRDQPGWITFSLDGAFAYPSTGDVIDTKTRQIVAHLTDENGQAVQSEKMVEVQWDHLRMVRVGDQFGLGRVVDEK